MTRIPPQTPENLNESPPFADVNLFQVDRPLQEAVVREGAGWATDDLTAFGARTGSAEMQELARLANEDPPVLKHGKLGGERADTVTFHPAYHKVMAASIAQGLHCATWEHLADGSSPNEGAHVARCAGSYMAAQMEAGHCCPVTMTHAAVAPLLGEEKLLAAWLPGVLSRDYDPEFRPYTDKKSATLGMGMTERQGGTDVRANTTRAEPVRGEGRGGEYRITGHKWFMSAPMSDAFLVLAQAPGGLSCFLVPRFLPDGSVNALHVLALKDKLGNRSNASSEVEFHDCFGWLVGEEGRGVPTILEMVTLTRLDCAVSSAGLMRFGLAAALHHCRHRSVFQKKLTDHPLMLRVLADMALETEAAANLVFRLARSFDGAAAGEDGEAAYRRLMTPVTKYWVCKIAPAFAYEAMECLGGNGYVEDASPLARVYREVPVNSIWEGSGNVMCLDVLRAVQRHPESLALVLEEWRDQAHGEPRLAASIADIEALLADQTNLEANGRLLADLMGQLAAGALMRANAPTETGEAYLATRFAHRGQRNFGALASGVKERSILERALPTE